MSTSPAHVPPPHEFGEETAVEGRDPALGTDQRGSEGVVNEKAAVDERIQGNFDARKGAVEDESQRQAVAATSRAVAQEAGMTRDWTPFGTTMMTHSATPSMP